MYSPKNSILDSDHVLGREKGWAITHSAVGDIVAINAVTVERSSAAVPKEKNPPTSGVKESYNPNVAPEEDAKIL